MNERKNLQFGISLAGPVQSVNERFTMCSRALGVKFLNTIVPSPQGSYLGEKAIYIEP